MTAPDACRGAFVPQAQAAAHDRVEEALRFAGAGPGRDERRTPAGNCPDRFLLVSVELLNVARDALLQVRVEQPLGRQVRHRRAGAERPREADERALEQRRAPRLVEGQQFTHLPMQARIRERIGPQLVAEKALEDFLREDDRV